MNEAELLDLWQASGDASPPAFTVRELAHREPTQRAGAARLPPVWADCATFLAATLEAHRARTLRRLQVWEFFESGRSLDRLQDVMGWSPRASGRPVLALSLLLLAVGGVGLALWTPPVAPAAKPLTPDPSQMIEALLAECRTYSDPEATKPDWDRADTACQRVLELEPLHPEANAAVRRISVLSLCEARFDEAQAALVAGLPEPALASLESLGKECELYLLRSMSLARTAIPEVKKRASADCRAYAANGKWDLALNRCGLYARLACQDLSPDELYPPASMTLKLEGPLNPKTEWRPSDPAYVAFLKARERLTPGEPRWTCPQIAAFSSLAAAPDPAALAKSELVARSPEPELGRALVLYFRGDFAAAPVPLQKLIERMDKAQLHQQAQALLRDMNRAINLHENGNAQLLGGSPERAEAPFLEALAVDERLILGDRAATLTAAEKQRALAQRESFLRRSITDNMGSRTYEKGRELADRKDFRAACRVWKLGSRFSRTNIDLLKALTNVCTRSASEAFERAETCEDLKRALDFAVDGDGFKEKIQEAMATGACR